MKPLPPPDGHRLNAAVGWFELGNRHEARAELESITTENQRHPVVLELRWSLCVEEKDWSTGLRIAKELVEVSTDDAVGWLHYAYALRRVNNGGVEQAWNFLRPVAEKFPDEPVIAFNLACYACQLNQLDAARHWFKRACEIGGEKSIKAMALADDDLKVLWPEIQAPE